MLLNLSALTSWHFSLTMNHEIEQKKNPVKINTQFIKNCVCKCHKFFDT